MPEDLQMRPTYKIEMFDSEEGDSNKKDITNRFQGLVTSLSVTTKFDKSPDTFSITVVNPDFKIKFPKFKHRLEIYMGLDSQPVSFGQFHVTKVTTTIKPDTMTITGTTTRFGGQLFQPQNITFNKQKTVTEIVEAVARACGMRPKVDLDATNVAPLIRHLESESYMNYLTRLAQQHNCIFKPEGDVIYFVDRRREKTFAGLTNSPINIAMSQISTGSISLSERDKIKNVSAVWHDVNTGKVEELKDITDQTHPADIFRLAGNYLSREAAQAAIKRFRRDKSDQHQEIALTIVGNPDIRSASRIITDDSFYPEYSREWFVNTSTHSINGSGYLTTLQATPLGDLTAKKAKKK